MTSLKFLCIVILALLISNCKRKENAPPPAPGLILPANNAQVHINNLNFVWDGTFGRSYLIEIARDSAFSNIIDSATIDSSKYFSALRYFPANNYGGNFPASVSGNFIMGLTYYWRVIRANSPTITSKVWSFYVIDTRDSILGSWSGIYNRASWSYAVSFTQSDTVYQGSLSISKNSDGSISGGGLGYSLYPSPAKDDSFSNGCASCGGSHFGASCTYNPLNQTIIFVQGSGGMGSGSTTTFSSTR